ncbi:hypothetical protein BCV70DRAFT_187632 [Testicularia cyperi]|uniref:SAC domain-containing protein n=1 Tax=Testicularia cyperi TaxID=1882483 RepID=A0A317XU18_9BASI|nr:hypothetical protein BCV70DRAFT_187632 [Testicularia cyperi]
MASPTPSQPQAIAAPASTAPPKPKESRSVSVKAANMIPDPAVSLSASRPTMLPPPRPSMAASSFINPTPTLTPGSTWGPMAASAAAARAEAAEPGRIGDLKRFTLWETKTRFYLVAYNTSQTRFRILKVDRTPPIANAPASSDSASTIRSETAPSQRGASVSETAKGAASSINSTAPKGRDATPDAGRSSKAAATSNYAARGQNVDYSVRGTPYLSIDDPQIARLNRQLLDAKQNDASSKDGPPGTGQSSSSRAAAPAAASSLAHTSSAPFSSSVNDPTPTSSSAARPSNPATHLGSSTTAGRHAGDAEWELNVTSDRVVYSRTQVAELLEMIREGNRVTGGLREVGRFFGIVGFIRFTGTYYMVLISRRSVVALIGGHYIYHCDETVILPVCHPSVMASLPGRTKLLEQEEARLLHLFKQVDLNKNFYFSYTYDLTQTLQDNLTSSSEELAGETRSPSSSSQPLTAWGYNEKFIWNHHLLVPAFGATERRQPGEDARHEWVLPLIYGFVDQAKLSVLSRTVYVTLIARRSRHFAGARFLKRGINERGHVANDVETEQIVSEALTTPFFAPGRKTRFEPNTHRRTNTAQAKTSMVPDIVKSSGLREMPSLARGDQEAAQQDEDDEDMDEDLPFDASPRYTSYVMMRGSIPVYWTQDSTNMSPRPPIEISLVDPYYSAAALHFDDLFHRYGTPVIVLNLIKSKEKQEREVKLLRAFSECVSYLNQFLPSSKKIRYIAWDMSRASKSHDQDVIGVLEDIAEETVETTRFFHSGPEPSSVRNTNVLRAGAAKRRETILLQEGVARVNCVDCLDRTNAAQFVIGKAAFGHQLHALGLLDDPSLPFDSDAVNMLTEMYHDLGDTIAMQYGGSALAHTTDTYRKINQWTSHSRDVLESMKRYYANSFADADKQAAINLFLGVDPNAPDFAPRVFPIKMVLPPHSNDHATAALATGKQAEDQAETNGPERSVEAVPFRPHYQHWYDPLHLEPRGSIEVREKRLREVVNADAGFWAEYYRPSLFTDLNRHHAFKMTAVHQFSHVHGAGHHGAGITSTGLGMSASQSVGSLSMYSPQLGGVATADVARHVRSGSISSLSSVTMRGSLAPTETATLVEYPSPFKPRGAPASTHGHNPHRQQTSRRSFDSINTIDTKPFGAGKEAAQSPSSTRNGRLLDSPSSVSTAVLPPSKAIIGGVRRWMSINRPEPHAGQEGSGTRRATSRRYVDSRHDLADGGQAPSSAPAGFASDRTTAAGGSSLLKPSTAAGGFDPQAFNFAGVWMTVNASVPAIAAANVPIEAALSKACNPQVSFEEESEYSFYTTQFLDEFVDSHRQYGAGGASLIGADGTSLGANEAPRQLGDHHHLLDEKDIKIYEEGVGISVERILSLAVVDPALIAYANSASASAAIPMTSAPTPANHAGGVGSAMFAPASGVPVGAATATTSGLAAAEAKARAYGSWLTMGQTRLASF